MRGNPTRCACATARREAEGRGPNDRNAVRRVPDVLRASDFGFRISDFFRPSGFGFRPSGLLRLLVVALTTLIVAATNSPDLDSSLLPPRGEIPPTFWELYSVWIVLGSALVLFLLAAVVWFAVRPKPAAPVSWSLQTRQQLQALRQQPPDGIILGGVGRILRRQIANAFGLLPGETTTQEFRQTLCASNEVGAELSKDIIEYLAECDRRKFAPSPPPLAPWDPFPAALSLVEKTEKRLAELQQVAASKADSDSRQSQDRSTTAQAAAPKSSGGS